MKKFISLLSIIILATIFILPPQARAGDYYIEYVGWYWDKNGNIVDVYRTADITYWLITHTPEGDKWVYYTPYGGNPNPDESGKSPKGTDPSDPTGLKWAIEHGDVKVIPKENPINSELFGFGGIGDGPATPFWNPYDEGSGRVSPSDAIGGEDTEKRLHLIESLKGGIPGSSGSSFTDAEGEFTGLPSSPSGGAGTGGGSGDNKGDGNTDRTANENGYFHDFSATDGLTIHPQAR